jgi:uncharacterized RmlC-like cupin family protein
VVCRVVRSGSAYEGKQGLRYVRGLTGVTAGSRAISMTLVTMPDGARAKAHLHRDIETAIYMIDGCVETFYGERLEERLESAAGDYVYIPPNLPHLVVNRSGADATALVAHTAANDQHGIVLLPELDELIL